MRDDDSVSEAGKAFVEAIRIVRFGCLLDVRLELTRLHALIGPNDSGKSTILAALRTAGELISHGQRTLARPDPRSIDGTRIGMAWETQQVSFQRNAGQWNLHTQEPGHPGSTITLTDRVIDDAVAPVRGATLVRWDPDAIRPPCELIPDGVPLSVGTRGEWLAAVYDAILSRDRAAFDDIEAGVKRHFPTVKGIWLPTSGDSKKALGVILTNGTRIHANEMSEGLLYWLAFAVLPHIDPTAMLLIEEPENGLHPSRIAEVMKVLRAISSRTQVILATHSPLVINELQPEEVTILTRDPVAGTRATRIDRTSHFQQRRSVYALGELWLSFADGVDEAALVPDENTNKSAG
jgi:predicted ATPase